VELQRQSPEVFAQKSSGDLPIDFKDLIKVNKLANNDHLSTVRARPLGGSQRRENGRTEGDQMDVVDVTEHFYNLY